MFDLPSPVIKGESVELSCIYDLETDSLYSIKWYKNNVEFYRYIPRDWPRGQFLPHKGIHVDVSGDYSCLVEVHDGSFWK